MYLSEFVPVLLPSVFLNESQNSYFFYLDAVGHSKSKHLEIHQQSFRNAIVEPHHDGRDLYAAAKRP